MENVKEKNESLGHTRDDVTAMRGATGPDRYGGGAAGLKKYPSLRLSYRILSRRKRVPHEAGPRLEKQ